MDDRKRLQHLQKRALELTQARKDIIRQIRSNKRKLQDNRALLNEQLALMRSLKATLANARKRDAE